MHACRNNIDPKFPFQATAAATSVEWPAGEFLRAICQTHQAKVVPTLLTSCTILNRSIYQRERLLPSTKPTAFPPHDHQLSSLLRRCSAQQLFLKQLLVFSSPLRISWTMSSQSWKRFQPISTTTTMIWKKSQSSKLTRRREHRRSSAAEPASAVSPSLTMKEKRKWSKKRPTEMWENDLFWSFNDYVIL